MTQEKEQKTFTNLTDRDLLQVLQTLVEQERKCTAELIRALAEVDRRKLYIQLHHNSLFAYLTEGLGFSNSAAQRRIDAARLMQAVPELKQKIQDGVLNLTQISLVSQGVRSKHSTSKVKMTDSEKKSLLELVQKKGIADTQKIVAQSLEIQPLQFERKSTQSDDSVRVEITFSPEQWADIEKLRDVLSNKLPSACWSKILSVAVSEFLRRKNPARTVRENSQQSQQSSQITSESEVIPSDLTKTNESQRSISAATRRAVFQRDGCCQWTGSAQEQKSQSEATVPKKCGSRHQLQVDHKWPRWAGGSNDLENLQLLCAVHNRQKYRNETGIKFAGFKS